MTGETSLDWWRLQERRNSWEWRTQNQCPGYPRGIPSRDFGWGVKHNLHRCTCLNHAVNTCLNSCCTSSQFIFFHATILKANLRPEFTRKQNNYSRMVLIIFKTNQWNNAHSDSVAIFSVHFLNTMQLVQIKKKQSILALL